MFCTDSPEKGEDLVIYLLTIATKLSCQILFSKMLQKCFLSDLKMTLKILAKTLFVQRPKKHIK